MLRRDKTSRNLFNCVRFLSVREGSMRSTAVPHVMRGRPLPAGGGSVIKAPSSWPRTGRLPRARPRVGTPCQGESGASGPAPGTKKYLASCDDNWRLAYIT